MASGGGRPGLGPSSQMKEAFSQVSVGKTFPITVLQSGFIPHSLVAQMGDIHIDVATYFHQLRDLVDDTQFGLVRPARNRLRLATSGLLQLGLSSLVPTRIPPVRVQSPRSEASDLEGRLPYVELVY